MENSNEKSTQTTVAKINNVEIIVIENGEKRIAVRPICDALGVAYQSQIERLKNDPLVGSTVTLSMTAGADGRDREMVTIPFMFVFGWLFRIDSRNVKEEARENVLKYQMECYRALYYHFTAYADFVEKKQLAIEQQLVVYEAAKAGFNSAKDVMKDAEQELRKVRQLRFDDYDAERRQLKMFSPEEMEG